eukprot:CAMPEP_0194742966 /NCGR_PEP_ID=MMETSP0296-20130528/100050_1 /TAXON_ID=39354 /ORGANISM="Heterosigma akashiwo, Strain CCMP2393" /LENGTH=233 /DNA_ID=CAMNT_0039654945 /DNA_START=493 /DNA_END=1195 /DNA_ORIENTATION=+
MEKEDQAQVESTGVRGGKKNHHALPRIDYIGESLSSKEKNGLVNFSLQDLGLQKVHRLAVHLDEAATLLAVSDRSGGFLSAEHQRILKMEENKIESVQVFGRKKTATAVAYCKKGRGLIKVNGKPVNLLEPQILQTKVYEAVLLLGAERFSNVDIRVRVKGGGYTSQIYAVRQAIAKAIVAYYQKYVDEASKKEIKEILMSYDRSLLVADPRRCEPKKFGGPSARARYQKSYR